MENPYSKISKCKTFQISHIQQLPDNNILNISVNVNKNENPYYVLEKEMRLNGYPNIFYSDLEGSIERAMKRAQEKEILDTLESELKEFVTKSSKKLNQDERGIKNEFSEIKEKLNFSNNSAFKYFIGSAIEGDDIMRSSMNKEIQCLFQNQSKAVSMALETQASQKQIEKIKCKFALKTQNMILEFEELQRKRKCNFEEEFFIEFGIAQSNNSEFKNCEDQNSVSERKNDSNSESKNSIHFRSCKLHLCLGLQKKFSYEVKITECELESYFIKKAKNLGKGKAIPGTNNYKQCKNGILNNHIFGAIQKCCIISFQESAASNLPLINPVINELLNWRNEIIFEGVSEQIGSFKNKSVVITKHSSIPPTNILFWVKKIDSVHLESVFLMCAEYGVKEILIPLEACSPTLGSYVDYGKYQDKKKFSTIDNIKAFGDEIKSLFKNIKRCLNLVSLKFPLLINLVKVQVIVPKISKTFEISREIAKSQFE